MDERGQGELQKEINGNLKTRVRHARDTHVEVNKAKLTLLQAELSVSPENFANPLDLSTHEDREYVVNAG
jgi:hypothetical protein